MIFFALTAISPVPDYIADFRADLDACGIAPSRAVVEYRDDFQDFETGVAGSEPVSDAQMTCIASAALKRRYSVHFADVELNRRYRAVTLRARSEKGNAGS